MHAEKTIHSLPFGMEEHIATNDLSQSTGMAGDPGGPGSLFTLGLPRAEDYRHRASRTVGEGVEWVYHLSNLGVELRRTIRKLGQKTKQEKDRNGRIVVRYLNAFYVYQEQTSYCMSIHVPWSPGSE
jgi:hypothetical protein